MLEFREKYNRDPEIATLEDDRKNLNQLRTEVMERLKVDINIVPEDFFL